MKENLGKLIKGNDYPPRFIIKRTIITNLKEKTVKMIKTGLPLAFNRINRNRLYVESNVHRPTIYRRVKA